MSRRMSRRDGGLRKSRLSIKGGEQERELAVEEIHEAGGVVEVGGVGEEMGGLCGVEGVVGGEEVVGEGAGGGVQVAGRRGARLA